MVAIIEKAEDGGYAVRSVSAKGVYGYGLTEQEAKDDFFDVLEEQAEFYKEKHGVFPDWYGENMDIDYRYDFSGFFKAFPFFNITQFARAVGINPTLMRKYKEGHAFASEKQKAIIQTRFDDLVKNISLVRF